MSRARRRWLGMVLLLLLLGVGSGASVRQVHGGVMAESTRVIYLEGQKERTLMLANTNAYPVLVQVWTNHGEEALAPQQALTPLIAVPPVFRLQPGALQGVRLILNGEQMPVDRESVFWLNIYEIPPTVSKIAPAGPRVAVAMNTQMKVFYRPKAMVARRNDRGAALQFRLKAGGDQHCLAVHNPTPYHASFSSIRLVAAGHERSVMPAQDMMTAPFSERCYALPTDHAFKAGQAQVRFTLLDDSGHLQEGAAPLE
jgi:P pilus assembly chaperone PapD